jgi:hypothetical protein
MRNFGTVIHAISALEILGATISKAEALDSGFVADITVMGLIVPIKLSCTTAKWQILRRTE